MTGLQFTDEAARQLEKAYLSRDVTAQRSETIRHLSLCAGERVLDIGCGPGFLCESMAEIVGPEGGRRRHRYLGRSDYPVQWAKNFRLGFL
jgi:arsenite methyltransferase